jgi:hypothetical protein
MWKLSLLLMIIFNIAMISNADYIYTFAGNGSADSLGDGGPATSAQLFLPTDVALSSTGIVYIADEWGNRVRVVYTNGSINTFAGNGNWGYTGDGGPAIGASIANPSSLSLSSNNELYIVSSSYSVVRLVFNNGTIATFAGNGYWGYSGDGGPAIDAKLYFPSSVAVSSGGEVYISDTWNQRIRIVLTHGTIATFAGNGSWGFSGDGDRATNAELNFPIGIDVSSTGEVFVVDRINNRIRVVFTNGTITTFAGNGTWGYSGDGGPAINAKLGFPSRVAVASTGEVYISDTWNQRIRVVFTNGTIATFAGNGTQGYLADGVVATDAKLLGPQGIAISPNGEVYIADEGTALIRIVVNSTSAKCSFHGTFQSQEYCICASGYIGGECQYISCYNVNQTSMNACSRHGVCESPNNCSCFNGYTGYNCQYSICYTIIETSSDVCSGNGICIAPNNCSCFNGFSGDMCQLFSCYGVNHTSSEVCSEHGICHQVDSCFCNDGYTGYKCQLNICYNVNQTSDFVCSGHGTCESPNNCSCFNGTTGYNCQYNICYGVNESSSDACSGHGKCIAPDNCECYSNSTGYNCQIELVLCYGKNGSSNTACSGHGLCKGTDFCECHFGYIGKQCQINANPFFSLLLVPALAVIVIASIWYIKKARGVKEFVRLNNE